MMRAGLLRHLVTIEHYTVIRLPNGTIIEDWAPFANVWAEVRDLRGREFWSAQQVQSEVTTRILIRYLPGVSSDMRVVHEGQVYEIDHILEPDGRRRELQLLCKRTDG